MGHLSRAGHYWRSLEHSSQESGEICDVISKNQITMVTGTVKVNDTEEALQSCEGLASKKKKKIENRY